jgi:dihydropyrimidine dehydrogenase (NAD+) subunit PreA
VKPIALHMTAALAREASFGLPISGIGGVTNWRDAVEILALGASSVQVCTEVMLRGYRIVGDMIEGLTQYMRDKGFARLDDLIGRAVPAYSEWGDLNMNYETVARIDASKCIGCNLCVVACHDGAHQCIHPAGSEKARAFGPTSSGPSSGSAPGSSGPSSGSAPGSSGPSSGSAPGSSGHVPVVDESECVGCNLCQIVCPVPDCITMDAVDNGFAPATWNQHLAGAGVLRPKKGAH